MSTEGHMKPSTIADPRARYGDGRHATRNFFIQRLTAMFNILFFAFFVWFVLRLAGGGRAEMVAVVGNPFVAIVLALLVVNVAVHMRIGMLEVIDDYVHDERAHRLLGLLNTSFAVLVAVVSVASIAKIVFWG